MIDAWETLVASGMPAGAARPVPATVADAKRLRSALIKVLDAGTLDSWQVTPLLAWLAAFRHHWPCRFRRVLGDIGDAAIDSLEGRLDDRNRYLKLRRIAIAHLSG